MPIIKSFDDVNTWIAGGRNANSRNVSGNTVAVIMPMGEIRIVFYNTPIVTYYPDGRVILNSGGFRTATTKSRLCEFSPIRVFASVYAWYVRTDSGLDVPFVEGMNVGKPTNEVLGRMYNQELSL